MGFKPLAKHIEAILKIALPTNMKPVDAFNGMINLKNHMLEWAKILKQSVWLMKKEMKFKWGNKHQKAFKKIKAKVAVNYVGLSQPEQTICHLYGC